MSTPAITATNLGKRYHISVRREEPRRLIGVLTDALTSPWRRLSHVLRGDAPKAFDLEREFWALKDVSFSISSGEVVGIIGRNGAGKSTLLKILSRITEPTEGEARIWGRVGSLLEVGTGFHPELTGKENVYLNGAILGMKRGELDEKLEEIVEFAEMSEFIDTPVKFYSSGMYIRLAFAVAAHLETEILLVDEVLAVGDIRFQKKCMSKMSEVGRQGRTVLFISHSMQAVTRLCPRVMLLDEGRLMADGAAHDIVKTYLYSGGAVGGKREWAPDEAPGNHVVRLRSVSVTTDQGTVAEVVDIRLPFSISLRYEVMEAGVCLTPVVRLFNEEGMIIFTSIDTDAEWRSKARPRGLYQSEVLIPGNLLAEGQVHVLVSINTFAPVIQHVYERDVVAFQVVDNMDGDSARVDFAGDLRGVVRPLLEWKTDGPREPSRIPGLGDSGSG